MSERFCGECGQDWGAAERYAEAASKLAQATASSGGHAFPVAYEHQETGNTGMSLRDYFAARAMHAMLNTELNRDMWASVEKISIDAYKQADAMLAARDRSTR